MCVVVVVFITGGKPAEGLCAQCLRFRSRVIVTSHASRSPIVLVRLLRQGRLPLLSCTPRFHRITVINQRDPRPGPVGRCAEGGDPFERVLSEIITSSSARARARVGPLVSISTFFYV